MSIDARRVFALAGLTLGASGVATALAQSSQPASTRPLDPLVAEKTRWVVEHRDEFFFWSRYEDLLRNPQPFPKPPSFYNPNVLVDGQQRGELPHASAQQRRISDAAWQQAVDWAFARNTHALIVMRNGRIEREQWAEGYFPGQMLPVRSFAKTLASLLIGIAIGEGRIRSIDEPVANYLAEWRDDPRGRITIRQFLTMSSGLAGPDRAHVGGPASLVTQLSDGADVNKAALAFPQVAEPDTVFGLNQVDSQILGLILERATGRSFADYLSEKLWRPIGAGPAAFNVDAHDQVRSFCCARSALSDWLRVAQLIAHQGRWADVQVVPASYVAEMLKPSKANPYQGLHLWLGWKPGTDEVLAPGGGRLQMPTKSPYVVDDVAFLMGGGFTMAWISPKTDLVVLRWGFEPPANLGWDNSAIPNLLLADLLRRR